MTGRVRATAFALGALSSAALAAAAGGGPAAPAGELGELREVVVSRAPIERGQRLTPAATRSALEVRRVPASFAPPDALADPRAIAGERSVLALPAGSYVTASALRAPAPPGGGSGAVPSGTTPVDLPVAGAGALEAAGATLVDVVVAGTPGPGPGAGRTYVAAERVRLLALARLPAETGLPDRWSATLALRRDQALRLIRAESLGRTIRLLAR